MTSDAAAIGGNQDLGDPYSLDLESPLPPSGSGGADGAGTSTSVLTIQKKTADGKSTDVQLPSMQDLEPPVSMTPEAMIMYIEQLSAKFMAVGAALADTTIKHHQKQSDIDTQKTIKTVNDAAKKVAKLAHKMKVMKKWKIGILIAGLVITGVTGGIAGGVLGYLAMAAFVVTATTGALDVSGEMDKWAEKDPEGAKAFQIAMMVIQLALALASIAAAIRMAMLAGGEIAAAATDETAAATEASLQASMEASAEASSEGTAAATESVAEDASIVTEESTEGITEEVAANVAKASAKKSASTAEGTFEEFGEGSQEAVRDTQIAAQAGSAPKQATAAAEESSERVAEEVTEDVATEAAKKAGPKDASGARSSDAPEGDYGNEGVKGKPHPGGEDPPTLQLANMIRRVSSATQMVNAGGLTTVEVEAADAQQDIDEDDADITAIDADLKFQRKMINTWIKFLKDAMQDFEKTMASTAEMSQNQAEAQSTAGRSAVVTSPTSGGTV